MGLLCWYQRLSMKIAKFMLFVKVFTYFISVHVPKYLRKFINKFIIRLLNWLQVESLTLKCQVIICRENIIVPICVIWNIDCDK